MNQGVAFEKTLLNCKFEILSGVKSVVKYQIVKKSLFTDKKLMFWIYLQHDGIIM